MKFLKVFFVLFLIIFTIFSTSASPCGCGNVMKASYGKNHEISSNVEVKEAVEAPDKLETTTNVE
jgi:hypothetical protein